MAGTGDHSDVFDRTLEDLTDEAEMAGNVLARSTVDSLYLRRNVEPDQALAIEKALKAAGIVIKDNANALQTMPSTFEGAEHETALDLLLAMARKYPFLNADEEAACGEAIQRGLQVRAKPQSDRTDLDVRTIAEAQKAQATLVTSNIRLVAKVAFEPRYRSRFDVDDLVQMGLIGLMRAAEKFDPAHEARFATYGMWWIRQGMSRGIADQGRTIRLPVHILERVARFRRKRRALEKSQGTAHVAVKQVADALGWTDVYTARIAQISEMKLVSLDAPIGADQETPLMDTIADPEPNPEKLTETKDIASHVRALVEELEDDRLRDIVSRRFGFEGEEETLQSLGDSYGVTRERIRQLEDKALRMLKRRATVKKLTPPGKRGS